MLQNVFVAGYPRKPEALGVHLTLVEIIRDTKVANVLARVEQQYPLVGTSLLPVFYPAGFRAPNEQRKFWKEARARRQQFISDINADSVEPAIILSETQEQILQPGSI